MRGFSWLTLSLWTDQINTIIGVLLHIVDQLGLLLHIVDQVVNTQGNGLQ